jgi:hypothetical protein
MVPFPLPKVPSLLIKTPAPYFPLSGVYTVFVQDANRKLAKIMLKKAVFPNNFVILIDIIVNTNLVIPTRQSIVFHTLIVLVEEIIQTKA